MTQIHASGLTRTYSSDASTVSAVRGVDLSISRGEYLAIMGPSGSGKTTLMNLLGLLDRPSEGQLLLEGQDVTRLTADARAMLRNRRIGFVFQNYNLLPRWTALENVELPLIYAGLGRAERLRQANEMLAAVGLGHRAGHWPTQLSGGEQQRVAIARAMVTRPAIVLADEPTGALDSETGAQVMGFLRDFNEGGMTIVLVTHDPKVAANADRVVCMRDGQFEDGTAPEVAADQPAAERASEGTAP